MRNSLLALLSLFLLAATSADASVVLRGTRVIFDGAKRETTLQIDNLGQEPVLIQSWLDTGDSKADPSTVRTPFLITPPIARIEANGGQTLRIVNTGQIPATDRETVYWLNVLEIPPKSKETGKDNVLRFAIRTRVKLFYRPAGLSEAALEARHRLTAQRTASGIRFTNPTPYHLSFSEVRAGTSATAEGGMIAPFSSLDVPLTSPPATGTPLTIKLIDDFGATFEHTLSLTS